MSSNTSSSGKAGGVGCTGFFVSMLTIVFITLKLTGTIDWSWVWVLSPIWITFIATGFLIAGIIVAVVIAAFVANRNG